MNVKLLKQVRDRIAARPRQFVMSRLFAGFTENGEKPSHCGTACCIAGWAFTLSLKKKPMEAARFADEDRNGWRRGWVDARRALEITEAQADKLFKSSRWPDRFRTAFKSTDSANEHARIAVRRINHFIKTKGRK